MLPLLVVLTGEACATAPEPASSSSPATARPWIGIAIEAGTRGVRITGINPGTPAEAAGLQVGDEVLSIDGVAVRDPRLLQAQVAERGVGTTVHLRVLRADAEVDMSLALAARPDELEALRARLVDRPMPALTVAGYDGPFSPDATRGHVVIVDFWATWCGPCRASMPTLASWYTAHADEGLLVVGVTGETRETVAKARVTEPYNLAYDRQGETNAAWGVTAIPMIAVVDATGVVRYAGIGSGENVEEAGRVAAKLLGIRKL